MVLEEDLSLVPRRHIRWLTAAWTPVSGHRMAFGLQGLLHTLGAYYLRKAQAHVSIFFLILMQVETFLIPL